MVHGQQGCTRHVKSGKIFLKISIRKHGEM